VFAAVSASLGLTAAWRAVTLERTPVAKAAGPPVLRRPVRLRAVKVDYVADAVDADPFQADRRRPMNRYRLPTDPQIAQKPLAAGPIGVPKLVGTVIATDGKSFVVVQNAAEPPRVARVGDKVGEYRIRRITKGRATLASGSGDTLEIRVPKAGAP
jgi:Tfp pilus assembly protein PilP